jgi:hypothetical protein
VKNLYFIGPLASDRQFTSKQRIIEEVVAQFGVGAHFPFAGGVSQNTQQIIREIQNCRFVLADLSRERPSCYFELGVAEAVGAEIALIAEAGTSIHQTQNRPVAFYSDLDDYRTLVGSIVESHAGA